MKLHELEKNIGATHSKKRVGRGSGSGLGKTSGKDKKVKRLVVVVASTQYSKVDNYHYIVVFQKEVSQMPYSKQNILLSM